MKSEPLTIADSIRIQKYWLTDANQHNNIWKSTKMGVALSIPKK